MGLEFGLLPTGEFNAITDVTGVLVGHYTFADPPRFNTGLTAVLPHGGNLFRERVPAAVAVGNGFGKLAGSTQVNELGELETPILLTGTLNVPRVADALMTWMLGLEGMEGVYSINPVVGETNDGYLSDIRARPLGFEEVAKALKAATGGPMAMGAVGAGRGTICFGFKGGIGTASRKLPESLGGWTVGVLVQSNFGGDLRIGGLQVGRALGSAPYQRHLQGGEDGSCMIIIATDAPLTHRNLQRLAVRSFLGLARTGGYASNGSGDYAIAFSTHPGVRRYHSDDSHSSAQTAPLPNGQMSPLFLAVVEATEEAIIDSMFMAEDVEGFRGTVRQLPLEKVEKLLENSH
jgi:D-aminopeptidase